MRLVVMGVSGCGKSSLGAALAAALALPFTDADDLHPAANRAKMAAGQPLTDADRWPWLQAVGAGLAGGAGMWPARPCAGPTATVCATRQGRCSSCTLSPRVS